MTRSIEIADIARGIADDTRRNVFIEDACGSNRELRREVDALLAGDLDAIEFHDLGGVTEQDGSEKVGDFIGRYQLVKKIGHGGFGVVWKAEQFEPVKRFVALKIIRLGMDTRLVVARFEQERQALAMMDHPHIARVLDAGATSTGRPYFVMDLVAGIPIGDYCDAQRLTVNQRLSVLEQVLGAVQHAHSKGIIHRDLKPTNILVSEHQGTPHATVIDFGIAKATSAKMSNSTIMTAQDTIIGTLVYMSPEQADGSSDIDTRSDVYSLGVILYELLTGSTPFNPHAMTFELQRQIREVDPPPPSIRIGDSREILTDLATRRNTKSDALKSTVRGDLDWIVMRALEKDRDRRYATVDALLDDVRHYLAGEAVTAAPPSRAYRLHKFVKRHRTSVAAAIVVFVTLVAGIIGTTWAMFEAQDQRVQADQAKALESQEREQAELVAGFLEKMMKGLDPTAEEERGTTLREQLMIPLTDAANQLTTFTGHPLTKARLSHAIGTALFGLSEYEKATLILMEAANIRRRILGAGSPPVRDTEFILSGSLLTSGKGAEAIRVLEQSRADALAANALTDVEERVLRRALASAYRSADRYEDSISMFQLLREELESRKETDSPEYLLVLHELGALHRQVGRYADAVGFLRSAVAGRERVLGADSHDLMVSMNSLAVALASAGDQTESIEVYRRVLSKAEKRYPAHHELVIGTSANLGVALVTSGAIDEGVKLLKDTLSRSTLGRGASDPTTLRLTLRCANTLKRAGRAFEALSMLEAGLEPTVRTFGAQHVETESYVESMCSAYRLLDRPADAIALLTKQMTAAKERHSDDSDEVLGAEFALAREYRAQRKPTQALPLVNRVYEKSKALLGESNQTVLKAEHLIGCCLFDQEKFNEAIATFTHVLAVASKEFGDEHQITLDAMRNLGSAYCLDEQLDKSIPLLERALAVGARRVATDGDWAFGVLRDLCANYVHTNQDAKYVEVCSDWFPLALKHFGEDSVVVRELADGLIERGRKISRPWKTRGACEFMLRYMTKQLGTKDQRVVRLMFWTAESQFTNQDFGSAHETYLALVKLLEQSPAASKVELTAARIYVALCKCGTGQFKEGREKIEREFASIDKGEVPRAPQFEMLYSFWVQALVDHGEVAEAESMARQVIRHLESQGAPPESSSRIRGNFQLAGVLLASGKFGEAEPIARDAASRMTQQRPGSGYVHLYAARHGECLLGLDRWPEAEPILLAAYDGLIATLDEIPIRLRGTPSRVRAHITKLYESWHKADPSGGRDAALSAWKAKHP